MKHIYPIIIKDLQQYTRNVQMIVFLFVMPIAFTLLFGVVFSGSGTDPGIQWNLGVANQDAGSTGTQLIELLEADDSLSITFVAGEEAELRTLVENGDYTAILVIPEDYTVLLTNGQIPRLKG